MSRLIYILPTVALFWFVDALVSENGTIGWERNCVYEMQRRLDRSNAREGILLGSSTSADWLPTPLIERLFRAPPGSVLDGHINGCHQDCTYAEVEKLLHEGRHYRFAIYGTNQFQMCEYEESKRVMQQRMMAPARALPAIFGHYAYAQHPLNYVGRFAGGLLSDMYADTAFLQGAWATALYGRDGLDTRWIRPSTPRGPATSICLYQPDEVSYKRHLTRALADRLDALADVTFVLLLPEVTLEDGSPKARRAWEEHRRFYAELAEGRPRLQLIDLTKDGAHLPSHFRDGFHLSAAGMQIQRALLEKQLRDRRLIP